MPRKRQYADDAEKQAAYRARKANTEATKNRIQMATLTNPNQPIGTRPTGRARWKHITAAAVKLLTVARSEMLIHFDSKPETWQETDAGQNLSARIDAIQTALDELIEI